MGLNELLDKYEISKNWETTANSIKVWTLIVSF